MPVKIIPKISSLALDRLEGVRSGPIEREASPDKARPDFPLAYPFGGPEGDGMG